MPASPDHDACCAPAASARAAAAAGAPLATCAVLKPAARAGPATRRAALRPGVQPPGNAIPRLLAAHLAPPASLLDITDYPALLRRQPDAAAGRCSSPAIPAVLWHPSVAIVGSRAPTPGGRDNAARFRRARWRASGLARDQRAGRRHRHRRAHQAALARGGRTVAVLGTGPDVPYPRANAALHRAHRRDAARWSASTRPAPARGRRTSRAATASSPGCRLGTAGDRGRRALRRADHRAAGRRRRPRGLRPARLDPQPAGPRLPPPDPRRRRRWSKARTRSSPRWRRWRRRSRPTCARGWTPPHAVTAIRRPQGCTPDGRRLPALVARARPRPNRYGSPGQRTGLTAAACPPCC